MARTLIGVMGSGDEATAADMEQAEQLGRLIAQRGWTLVTGGRNAGVMHAASRGAKENGGLVIGILPGDGLSGMSEYVDIPIITGMGSARNNINVLSSKVVVACGTGPGTVSEIALALKAKKPVILTGSQEEQSKFFKFLRPDLVRIVHSPEDAIEQIIIVLESQLAGEWTRPTRSVSEPPP